MRRSVALCRTFQCSSVVDQLPYDHRPDALVGMRWKPPEDALHGSAGGNLTPRRVRSGSSRGGRQSPDRQRRRSPHQLNGEGRSGGNYERFAGRRSSMESSPKPRVGSASMARLQSSSRSHVVWATGGGHHDHAVHPLENVANTSSAPCVGNGGGGSHRSGASSMDREREVALEQEIIALSARLATTERERNWALDALRATEAELQASFVARDAQSQNAEPPKIASDDSVARQAKSSSAPEDAELHLRHYRVLVEMLSTRCRLLEQWLEEETQAAAAREADARQALETLEEHTVRLGSSMVEQQRAFKAKLEALKAEQERHFKMHQGHPEQCPEQLPSGSVQVGLPCEADLYHGNGQVVSCHGGGFGMNGRHRAPLETILEAAGDVHDTRLEDTEHGQLSLELEEDSHVLARCVGSAEATAAAIAAAEQLSMEIQADQDDAPGVCDQQEPVDDMASLAATHCGSSEMVHLSDSWDTIGPLIHERRGRRGSSRSASGGGGVGLNDDRRTEDPNGIMASDVLVRASPEADSRSPDVCMAQLNAAAVATAGAACARATVAAAAAGGVACEDSDSSPRVVDGPAASAAIGAQATLGGESRWRPHAGTPGLLSAGLQRTLAANVDGSSPSLAFRGSMMRPADQVSALPAPRFHSPPAAAMPSGTATTPNGWGTMPSGSGVHLSLSGGSSGSRCDEGGVANGDGALPPSPQFGNFSSDAEVCRGAGGSGTDLFGSALGPIGSAGIPEDLLAALRSATDARQAAKIWTRIGQLQQRQKNFAEARSAYLTATELDSSQHGCLANLAQLEAHAGDLTTAMDLIQQAIALEPTSSSYVSFANWLQAASARAAPLMRRSAAE